MLSKKSRLMLVLLSVSAIAMVGCSDDDDNSIIGSNLEPTLDIVETAIAAGNFKTLVAAIEAADLVDDLKGEGPFTVFAPNDEAFAALPEGTVEALLQDPATLASILTYHVVAGKVKAAQVVNIDAAQTLNGQSVSISITKDGNVMVDNATVIATDILCSNGVIHVIDAVILPGEGSSISGLASTAKILVTDGSNVNSMPGRPVHLPGGKIPIFPMAHKAGLNTLAAAVEAAGLQQTLTVSGPFTVFAPTDEAFAALPDGALEALLQDPEALTQVLLYHVISGVVKAEDVVNLTEATMMNGQSVSISADTDVMVNDANVIATDIMARNGVVHLIDKVLLPQR